MARLVASADFRRVLGTRSRAATEHFAVHHMAGRPVAAAGPASESGATELSTEAARELSLPVDDLRGEGPAETTCWLGAVVPKRHARRAVTRSLLRRQIHAAAERRRDVLPSGLWIVRLRAPFERVRFASAASSALRLASRSELDALFASALSVASH